MMLLLFFLSGATALVYEVIWSKYLALMFGSTVQAQTVVLAVFMGGLALGNRIFGRRSDVLAQPLAAYGYLEGAIGLYAFFFPSIHHVADTLFTAVGSSIYQSPWLLLALKGALSLALLLLPTVLMGGTLPLVAAWLQHAGADAGRRSARFYSVNSLGAVAGSGLAGFLLIRELGMVSALQMTALVNVFIAVAAVAIARRDGGPKFSQKAGAATPEPTTPVASGGFSARSACLFVALTGGVSMGLEVLSSRTLALIFGGSLQAFAIVLMAFILGIGLGSAMIASSGAKRFQTPSASFGLMLGGSIFVGAFILNIETWIILYAKARTGLAATDVGYVYHQFLISGVSLLALGLPAGLLGAVLPLWIRVLSQSSTALGGQVGRLLTWNTLGAVAGVLLTGFVLMPALGVRGAFCTLALVLAVVALAGAWTRGSKVVAAAAGVWIVALGTGYFATGKSWQNVLGSGIFRLRTADVPWDLLEQRKKFIEVLFHRDGPDASVSVEKRLKRNDRNEIVLRINGKPDASTEGDLSTQYLLGHLPMLARPQSKDVFVLGFGSGITGGAVLGHPVERLTIAENCGPILEAAKLFAPWNRGVMTNARTRIFREDARTVLKLDPQRYDVIISEPSNPWVAGIGSVFSREFYEIAANRLKEGGVMAQWFHIYEMHDGIVQLVLRTFGSVFPYLEIWDTLDGDIILLGSRQPWNSSPEVYRQVYEREVPRRDLERIGLKTPESLLARQIASQRTAFAIPGDGAMQSDGFPVLEYAAPKAFFFGAPARKLFNFDERTWQSAFASPAKRQILLDMPDSTLLPVFAEFSSCNPELVQYIRWRVGRPPGQNTHGIYREQAFNPLIFRPPDSFPTSAEVPPKASALIGRLQQAQAKIYSAPAEAEEAIRTIETALAETPPPPAGEEADWQPAHFAAVAARARYTRNDVPGALKAVEQGKRFVPDDQELGYLFRLLTAYAESAKPTPTK